MANDNNALIPVTPTRSPAPYSRFSDSPDNVILHSLNMKLQLKVYNLENEVSRLKDEVRGYKGKSFLYESLTKDLATLRAQLDKTALALLRKCKDFDSVKRELANIKFQHNVTPCNAQETPTCSAPKKDCGKRKLAIYNDIMSLGDNEDIVPIRRTSRPSMGSCGNLAKQISAEEAMPSCLKPYAEPAAPLRNRVLMKLHTLRSASTESLESVGRKSMKAHEAKPKPIKVNKPIYLEGTPQPLKGSGMKAPLAARPALGPNNSRVIKVNTTSIKKSNSSCSTKSNKPAFRY